MNNQSLEELGTIEKVESYLQLGFFDRRNAIKNGLSPSNIEMDHYHRSKRSVLGNCLYDVIKAVQYTQAIDLLPDRQRIPIDSLHSDKNRIGSLLVDIQELYEDRIDNIAILIEKDADTAINNWSLGFAIPGKRYKTGVRYTANCDNLECFWLIKKNNMEVKTELFLVNNLEEVKTRVLGRIAHSLHIRAENLYSKIGYRGM